MESRRSVLGALAALGLAGCQSPVDRSASSPAGTPDPGTGGGTPTSPTAAEHWSPRPQPTGNRRLAGSGDLRGTEPVDIAVEDPRWLVALPAPRGSDWLVVAGDGSATLYRVTGGTATRRASYDPVRGVPVVRRREERVAPVRPPASVSPLAPPAFADGGEIRAALGTDGALLLTDRTGTDRLSVGALPDGRIVRLGERLALLGDATDRYRHGALGDDVEGGSLLVVDPGAATVETRATVGPPAVIEGQAPIVADLDDDGRPELVVAVSDAADGARIAAFTPDGDRLATGPIHGSGWRHPLVVAPFGPGGRPELAVVRKPHVEHVLEFYRLAGGSLEVTATLSGVRSHTYGSRVLDGAVAADFDDDGRVEALVPTTRRDALAAVARAGDAATVAWTLSLPGPVRTNVTGVALDDRVAVGAGTRAGVRIWQG